MKKIFLLLLISLIVLTACESKKEENLTKIVENNGMLSYTIDGEKTDIKPTKEEGYIVNKIICDNGTDMMWDNDNWEVELTKVNSKDRCKVDFTKDTSKEGYRIAVTSNSTSSLDSLSKSTVENGTIKIYSKSIIKSVTGCNGVIEDNKVIISNVTFNQTCYIAVEQTLVSAIKEMYPPKSGRTNFNVIDNGTPALYTDTDDQGETYYFSGDGSRMNNWVRFAGKMWRIIRINGNGSVRILYSGSGGTDGYIELNKFNSSFDYPYYVGWKYSSSSSDGRGNTPSEIYKVVNNWYNGLGSTNQSYIDSNAIYCNDRSGKYSTSTVFNSDAYERLSSRKSPTFKCMNNSDKFTEGFGLMTADEVVYAGGKVNTINTSAYYFQNINGGSSTGEYEWYTMTSTGWNDPGRAGEFVIAYNSILRLNWVNYNNATRPVISLKKEVLVTGGDGSAENPYEVTI